MVRFLGRSQGEDVTEAVNSTIESIRQDLPANLAETLTEGKHPKEPQ